MGLDEKKVVLSKQKLLELPEIRTGRTSRVVKDESKSRIGEKN